MTWTPESVSELEARYQRQVDEIRDTAATLRGQLARLRNAIEAGWWNGHGGPDPDEPALHFEPDDAAAFCALLEGDLRKERMYSRADVVLVATRAIQMSRVRDTEGIVKKLLATLEVRT